MSIAPDQIITCPASPDLLQAGLGYARQAVVKGDLPPAENQAEALRHLVVEKAAELAFRRALHAESVPHELIPAASFRWAGFYDAAIGGRRVAVVGYSVTQGKFATRIQADPAALAGSAALIPAVQDGGLANHEDVLVFACITGQAARGVQAIRAAAEAGDTLVLGHGLPPGWAAPQRWASLGPLALKSDSGVSLDVSLHGLDAERRYQQTAVTLPPHGRVEVGADFYTLAYIECGTLPDGLLSIHSPALGETHRAATYDWSDLWLRDGQIYLVGYLGRGEFYHQASLHRAGHALPHLPPLRLDHHAVPVQALQPLPDLFERAKAWAQARHG